VRRALRWSEPDLAGARGRFRAIQPRRSRPRRRLRLRPLCSRTTNAPAGDVGCRVTVSPRGPRGRVRSSSAPTLLLYTGTAIRARSTTALAATRELARAASRVRDLPRPSDPRTGARRADIEAVVRPTTAPNKRLLTGPPARSRSRSAEPRLHRRSGVAAIGRAATPTRTCSITATRASRRGAGRSLSVQYTTEASPGPQDESYLFARFAITAGV